MTSGTDELKSLALCLIDEIFGHVRPRDFAIRLWDGTTWGSAAAELTIALRHPGALRRMFLKPNEENLARCYVLGDFDIEGDFETVTALARKLLSRRWSWVEKLQMARYLRRLPAERPALSAAPAELDGRQHSAERDREAVTHHYDVSNAFYKLWLDERMVYSCAYFDEGDDDLERAQLRKLDLLCRKLRLRPGQRLLDIGCGWGGLLKHAVEQYGVEGYGVTLSQPQADEANARFAAAGIADRCRAEVRDYRAIEGTQVFDHIVSVGMIEHVGVDQLEQYFATAERLLRPEGSFLLHGIGDLPGRPERIERGFVRSYVFPDSDLPPIPRVLGEAERHQFEVRDVESLRENYTRTLRHWARRLEANRDEAVAEVGEATYRIWRLYMSGCAWWFNRGYISVFQSLLVKRSEAGSSGLPINRFDWYNAPQRLDQKRRAAS